MHVNFHKSFDFDKVFITTYPDRDLRLLSLLSRIWDSGLLSHGTRLEWHYLLCTLTYG